MLGGHISEIEFNEGSQIHLEMNSVIIFVGPNNVGKSKALSDINELLQADSESTVIVKKVKLVKDGNKQEMLEFMKPYESGYKRYQVANVSVEKDDIDKYDRLNKYRTLNGCFTKYIYANNMPSFRNMGQPIGANGNNNPIGKMMIDEEFRNSISETIRKAFNLEIQPYISLNGEMKLVVGKEIDFGDETFHSERERQSEYFKRMEKYPAVDDQGDGIKSFLGLILEIQFEYYRTILIDEPEKYLHPPQAYMLGKTLGNFINNTSNKQLLISTHSENFIKGLMDVIPERVNIVRITRAENTNRFDTINNETLEKIWSDPVLKYSNILEGLFYHNIVICEGESDCKMYEIIYRHMKEEKKQWSETLFVYCNGKKKIPCVVEYIRNLGVNFVAVMDLDMFKEIQLLRDIVRAAGGDYERVKDNYRIMSGQISGSVQQQKVEDIRKKINTIFDESNEKNVTSTLISSIRETLKTDSSWTRLSDGIVPPGDATKAINVMIGYLNELHVFPVPLSVGELEHFIREGTNHGAKWIENILSEYPDINSKEYDTIKDFVDSWRI